MKKLPAAMGVFLFASTLCASDLRPAIEAYVAAHKPPIFSELIALLSIPNVAADRNNVRRNAEHLRRMLERRGFAAEIIQTAGNPLAYAEMKAPGAQRTVLFYAHYDGQPVDPPSWNQASPFQPILRDGRMEDGAKEIPNLMGLVKFEDQWRIYNHSASDDKSPIVALCTAVDALPSADRNPTSNIRVVLDGEEEAGSASLTNAIERYRDKLRADIARSSMAHFTPAAGRP